MIKKDDKSPYLDSSEFCDVDIDNYYDSVKSVEKEDVLHCIESLANGFFTEKNQSIPSSPFGSNSLLRSRNISSNRLTLNNNGFGLNNQRHANTKSLLIPCDRTCDIEEQEIIKYGLEKLPDILETLTNKLGHVFSIITNVHAFNILIDDSSIPHILGFLNIDDCKNNNTRFYNEVIRKLDFKKDIFFKKWNSNKRKLYIEVIKDVIERYKKSLLYTYSSKDNYEKDLFGKISLKSCNLDYLFENVSLFDINNIEIFNSISDKNTYLLTIKIKEKDLYCSLVITKEQNNFIYYLKSGGILNKNEYDSITNSCTLADNWKKTNFSVESFLFEIKPETLSKVNNLIENKSNFSCNKKFSEIKTKYNSVILENIFSLLSSSNIEEIKKDLPFLLIKLYYNDTSMGNDNYYFETLLFLVNTICKDDEILNLVNNCYTNNKNEINNILRDSNCSCEFSISIVKKDFDFYLNAMLNIQSEIFEWKNNIITQDKESLFMQFNNLNKKLEDLYFSIQAIKLTNINDVKNYILLTNNYYYIYNLFQSYINNLYSFFMTKGTKIEDLCVLANSYPYTFNLLTNIGYSKTVSDNNNFIIQLINETRLELGDKLIYDKFVKFINENDMCIFNQFLDGLLMFDDKDSFKLIELCSLILINKVVGTLRSNNYKNNSKYLNDIEEKLCILMNFKNRHYNTKILKKVCS